MPSNVLKSLECYIKNIVKLEMVFVTCKLSVKIWKWLKTYFLLYKTHQGQCKWSY